MNKSINLHNMSAEALDELSNRAKLLAYQLRQKEPGYELALEAGVVENSYTTVRWGRIDSYKGEAVVTLANGSKWRAVGHGPKGNASHVSSEGFIEFIPIEP